MCKQRIVLGIDISFVNVFDGRSFGPLRKMPVDRAEGYRS